MSYWEKKDSFSSWVLATHWAHLKRKRKKKNRKKKTSFLLLRTCCKAGDTTLHVWMAFLFCLGILVLSLWTLETHTVASHTSYPWISWEGPAESYRFLSVWGTSAWCRTHGSWGVQFICRRPGRQILQEKGMHSTTAHPRALESLLLLLLRILSSALSIFISTSPSQNSDHPQENPVKVTRMKPNSFSLLGFLD